MQKKSEMKPRNAKNKIKRKRKTYKRKKETWSSLDESDAWHKDGERMNEQSKHSP